MMKERERYFASPPLTDTSLTVPQTQSSPMSPPGKKQGDTTKLSVENTSCSPPGTMAPSPRSRSASLPRAGSSSFSMSAAVFFPPLP